MRELTIVQACPDDNYYIWQTHTWIESLKQLGLSSKAVSCIFVPGDRKELNPRWQQLVDLYPEAKWFFQKDEDNISKFLPLYIPILRPYVLGKYFKLNPDLKDKAILYCDADVVFTEHFNISHLLDDEVSYLSNTLSYINADYFSRKENDVKPSMKEEYKKRDVIDELAKITGITKEIIVKNNDNSGGAQYLMKGIDGAFWDKVLVDCLVIRKHLLNTNRIFFENESKGFQSWASDMWAVLYNLWFLGKETKIVPEMDFAWSTDPITKLEKVGILHNAGVVAEFHGKVPMFNKGKYINSPTPFTDCHLDVVLNNSENQKLCNNYYLKQVVNTYNKYKILY